MHNAALIGHNDICSLFLEKGADIAARDTVSDAEIEDIYHTCMPSRAHTLHLPAPGVVHNVSLLPYPYGPLYRHLV